ncbi:MAG: hypothetical protein M1816_006896 [Peltula sp. TS41687]|nr:MAG: hypothetical protein M1816_006896 [Peltula sp. TS41687]
MSDVQRFLLTIDNDPKAAAQIYENTAKSLESKGTKLVDVVQSLGEYLTDEDATIRAKGSSFQRNVYLVRMLTVPAVAYFAGVLSALDPKFLSRQQIAQVNVSVQFFCDRIRDASGLKEAAQGLQALQRCHRFTGENAVQTAKALFTTGQDLRQHPQGTRFVVLILLDSLLSNQRDALKGMGEEFILGMTDRVGGEKDPRNLMVIFSMLKVLMVEWDIVNHVEVRGFKSYQNENYTHSQQIMFDSVFCYFPITFRPPPDDPYGITAQDLKNRLRACIASTSLFARFTFPALLDKLDSTSPNVKKDVLQTITACTSSYDVTTVSAYTTQLWESLKYEILNAQEEDLAEEALLAAKAIAKCLSTGEKSATPQSPLGRFLRPITTECNRLLQEPQQKQAKPAGQILGAISSASPAAFVHVVKAVVAPLLTVYQDAGGLGKQRALLNVLNVLFESATSLYGTWNSLESRPELENPLGPFKDRLYELYSRTLMGTAAEEVSFRLVALKGLTYLAILRDYLTNDEIQMVIHYLDEILLSPGPHGHDGLKEEAIQALIQMSKMKSNLIMDITFPAFMAKLPDSDKETSEDYLSCLEALAKLSVEEHIFELFLRRLLNKLDIVLLNYPAPAYPRAILSAILYVLGKKDLENDPKLETYFERLVVGLIRKVAQPIQDSKDLTALNDESVLHVIGKLANVIIRALPKNNQDEVARNIYTYFVSDFPSLEDLERRQPEQRRTIILSTYLLASLRLDVTVSTDIETLFNQLVDWAVHETDSPTRMALLIQICLLTNKWLLPEHRQLLQRTTNQLMQNLINETISSNSDTVANSLRLLLYLSKAIILRLDSLTTTLLNNLLDLLSDPHYGLPTARGFSILLGPHDLLASTTNFLVTRQLHKQRVFYQCMPRIASDIRSSASAATKPNYLIALAGIIHSIPTEIIMPQLDTLLPLLLQSIDLPDNPGVKEASIQTLAITVRDASKVVEGYIGSLITRLLSSITVGSASSSNPVGHKDLLEGNQIQQRVRTAALQCLQLFPKSFRHELLLGQEKRVVKELLLTALDDPKRDVRKEAVDCRAAWLRLGEDDEDD